MVKSYWVTVLRFIVGWHFLYEGLWKLFQGNWSAASYLKSSQWIASGLFHKIAETPHVLGVVNPLNMWGLTLIGLALILGVFIRFSSACGIALLTLYYLAQPPFAAKAAADGHFLWVDRNVVEAIALAVICAVPSYGVGALFKRWLCRGEATVAGDRREFLKNLSALPVLGAFAGAFFEKHGRVWEKENLKNTFDAVTSATVRTFEFKDMSALKKPIDAYGKIGPTQISRMFMGCNLIGGWAHARDLIYVSTLVKAYHEDWRVFRTLHMAEAAGMNTIILNPGLFRVMGDYLKKEGGKMQVLSDCAVGGDPVKGAQESIKFGAQMLYIQGEMTEKYIVREKNYKVIEDALAFIRKEGYQAGIGAHSLDAVKECVARGLVPDYWVKTIHPTTYWSANINGGERHDNIWCTNPDETIAFMKARPEPWIGFKTLAAGAVEPKDGFPFALKAGADFLCVGMYDFQLVDNVNLFNEIFPACQKRDRPWHG